MEKEDTKDDRGNWIGYLQIAVIVGIIAIAIYFARAPEQVAIDENGTLGEKQPPIVTIMQPESQNYNFQLDTTGSITLKERVTITSEVKGRVVWVSSKFEPGGTIEANEVFIKIDPRVYELEVEEAAYKLAVHEIELEKQKSLGADVDRLEALRNQASVQLDLARLQLTKTELSLPYNFKVISSSVEIGELAGTAETTGTASILGLAYRPDSIRVDVPIEMQDIQTLDPIVGRTANVMTSTEELGGVITGLGSIVAPKSRLATVYIKFDSELNPSEYPLPNSFVEVEIIGPTEQNVFLLPERSEKSLGQVWLVRNGQLESFEPQILARNNGMLVVKAFDTGDGIAIDIPANMHDGMTVTAVPVGS